MNSQLLVEYMRTGTIPPLAKGDTKNQVGSKLGPPNDWKGRVGGIGWFGPLLTDYHDSWAWHYGSLCVTFPEPDERIVPGISLNVGFGNRAAPIHFPAPFAELPQSPFMLRELTGLLDEHCVRYERHRTGLLVSEGDIAIVTTDCKYLPDERVTYLFPHSAEQIEADHRRSRQRRIEMYSELLRRPGLPAEDRLKWEQCLRKLKAEEDLKNA